METYGWMIWEHEGDHFHNSYLTALVETGLVGLIALVAILLVALSAGVRRAQYQRSQPDWASASLPFVLLCGALAHAIFETGCFRQATSIRSYFGFAFHCSMRVTVHHRNFGQWFDERSWALKAGQPHGSYGKSIEHELRYVFHAEAKSDRARMWPACGRETG